MPNSALAIFLRAIGASVLLFTAFGALCYAALGSTVVLPVTLNVHAGVVADVTIRLGYSVAVVFTYPLQLLPIADMLELSFSQPPAHCAALPALQRRLLARLLLVAFTCLVAIFGADQFDHFVSLIGAVCGVPLSFVLPNLIYLKLAPKLGCSVRWRRVVGRVAVVIGVVGATVSGTSTLLSWVQESER